MQHHSEADSNAIRCFTGVMSRASELALITLEMEVKRAALYPFNFAADRAGGSHR